MTRDGQTVNYDLYSEFGCALGTDPSIKDEELNNLRVAVLPLPGGEFYHSVRATKSCLPRLPCRTS